MVHQALENLILKDRLSKLINKWTSFGFWEIGWSSQLELLWRVSSCQSLINFILHDDMKLKVGKKYD